MIILLLFLTACGNRLTCSLRDDDRNSQVRYVMNFNGDELQTVTWTYSVTLIGNRNTPADIERVRESAETEAAIFNGLAGVIADVTVRGNRVTMTVEFELSEMAQRDINRLDLDLDRQGLREFLTEEGFTCR